MHVFLSVKVQVLVRIVVKIGELDKSTTKPFAMFSIGNRMDLRAIKE